MTPEFDNYLDCGSVQIYFDDPSELLAYSQTQEPSSDVRLYTQTFEQKEMGRVLSASLSLSKDQEGTASLRGRLEHSHKIDSPRFFSSKLLVAMMRKLRMDNVGVTSVLSDSFVDSYAIESDAGAVKVQTIKRAGHNPDRIDRRSRRNSLVVSAELTPGTTPDLVRELLEIWATSFDLLSNGSLHLASDLRPGVTIDLRSITGGEDKLQTIMSLEEYDRLAKENAGEITLPYVDFEDLNLKCITEMIDGDTDALTAALAGCALSAVRIYGKTGTMPSITTQALSDAIISVRNGADY